MFSGNDSLFSVASAAVGYCGNQTVITVITMVMGRNSAKNVVTITAVMGTDHAVIL